MGLARSALRWLERLNLFWRRIGDRSQPNAQIRAFRHSCAHGEKGGGLVASRYAAGDHVDEVLQVPGPPALEGAVAVALVGGHNRVAVVPVEARLGVEPEEPAG